MTYDIAWQTVFNVALAALEVAADAGIGGDSVGPLLRAVVAVRNSEQRVLEDIRQDVRALLEGPWRAGDLFLVEAQQCSGSPEAQMAAVELARQRFIDACGNLVNDHFSRALVEYRTAVCYLCLGAAPDARRWFARAYESGGQALSELEHGSEWRRLHLELVDKARGVLRDGFARYVLPKRTPQRIMALYDLAGAPERKVLAGALSGYEKLVLRSGEAQREREKQAIESFLSGLQPLLAA